MSISQKLRITGKKSFMQTMSIRSIPIYLTNLVTFEESWIFELPKRPFGRPLCPNAICCGDMKLYAHHFFSLLPNAHLLYQDGHFSEGGLHIRSWDRAYQLLIIPCIHFPELHATKSFAASIFVSCCIQWNTIAFKIINQMELSVCLRNEIEKLSA